jgi:hypothetical protein
MMSLSMGIGTHKVFYGLLFGMSEKIGEIGKNQV